MITDTCGVSESQQEADVHSKLSVWSKFTMKGLFTKCNQGISERVRLYPRVSNHGEPLSSQAQSWWGEEKCSERARVKRLPDKTCNPWEGHVAHSQRPRGLWLSFYPPSSPSSFYHFPWAEPKKEPEFLSPGIGLWGFGGLDDFM